MKRLISLIFIAVLLIASLSACDGDEAKVLATPQNVSLSDTELITAASCPTISERQSVISCEFMHSRHLRYLSSVLGLLSKSDTGAIVFAIWSRHREAK